MPREVVETDNRILDGPCLERLSVSCTLMKNDGKGKVLLLSGCLHGIEFWVQYVLTGYSCVEV